MRATSAVEVAKAAQAALNEGNLDTVAQAIAKVSG